MASKQSQRPDWGLVLIRVTVGAIFAAQGWSKVDAGVDAELVLGTRDAFEKAPSLIAWWGQNVVLRFPELFAYLIAWGELLGGAAMMLGALTRPACIALAVMLMNFYFVGPQSERQMIVVLTVCCLACALSRAGRRLGMDETLDRRWPNWMTWVDSERRFLR